MKLIELTGIKHMYDKELGEIIDALSEKGTKQLGRGMFGIALLHSSKPEVIKFWIKDSAYDTFIDYVQKHPNEYFPKLYSKPKELSSFFLRPVDFPEKIKYVRMEVLKPVEQDPYELYQFFKGINGDRPKKEILDEIMDFISERSLLDCIGKTREDFDKFYDLMKKFLGEVLTSGNGLDIHSGNVMMRGDQLVLTDPIYNSNDLGNASKIETQLHNLKKKIENSPTTPHKVGRSKGSSNTKGSS